MSYDQLITHITDLGQGDKDLGCVRFFNNVAFYIKSGIARNVVLTCGFLPIEEIMFGAAKTTNAKQQKDCAQTPGSIVDNREANYLC